MAQETYEIFSPKGMVELAKIVARGTIKLPIRLIKYIVNGEEELNVTFFCRVSNDYLKWIPGLLAYKKKFIRFKDLELMLKMLGENKCNIFGYFSYNDQLETFSLEKAALEQIIEEEKNPISSESQKQASEMSSVRSDQKDIRPMTSETVEERTDFNQNKVTK